MDSKMNYYKTYKLMILSLGILTRVSCAKHPDSPGYEYVPDMYRSQAIEAYVDYGLVKDVEHKELKSTQSARLPVEGTIPFVKDESMIDIFMPFNYGEGEDERIRAGNEVFIPDYYIKDSIVAASNVTEGKRLYGFYCTHCHGAKGEADGKVVSASGDLIVPQAYNATLKDRSLGSIFHTITFGKNAMGPHGSMLNKDERWKVAMYVRTLQHGEIKLDELKLANTQTRDSLIINN